MCTYCERVESYIVEIYDFDSNIGTTFKRGMILF